MRRSIFCLAAVGLWFAPLPAHSGTLTVTGTLLWTDAMGGTHAVRLADVDLRDAEVFPLPDVTVESASTNNSGEYTFVVDNDDGVLQGTLDVYLNIFANGIGHHVSPDGAEANTYINTTTPIDNVPDGTTVINVTAPTTSVLGRAFSVNDAIHTAEIYAAAVAGPIQSLNVDFTAGASNYTSGTSTMRLLDGDAFDWDVILHEYGHHLAAVDNLDDNPGLAHNFGQSQITVYDKDRGTRLAWGEALATYISMAIQDVTSGLGLLPNVPKTNDLVYHDLVDAALAVGVETKFGSANVGEGDEASVMRILYDIADGGVNEGFDKISIGHDDLYSILDDDIAGLDKLDHLWDHFFANTGDLELGALAVDEKRALLGRIFEEYAVAPDPMGAMVNGFAKAGAAAPTFSWARQNNNANDTFTLFIFDDDFARLFPAGIAVAGDVTSYTLSAAEWNVLKNSDLGTYRWVVAGSDTTDFATGSYWSGDKSFTLVPEPGVALLLCCALWVARRRGWRAA